MHATAVPRELPHFACVPGFALSLPRPRLLSCTFMPLPAFHHFILCASACLDAYIFMLPVCVLHSTAETVFHLRWLEGKASRTQ